MAKTATFTVTQEGSSFIGPILPLGDAQVFWKIRKLGGGSGINSQPKYGRIVFMNSTNTMEVASYNIGSQQPMDYMVPISIASGTYNVHVEHKESVTGIYQISESQTHTFEDGGYYELDFII